MTIVAGGPRSTPASPARLVRTLAWVEAVPRWTTSTGVSGLRPASTSRRAISPRAAMPMRTTIVPPTPANAAQSTAPGPSPSPRCPLTTVTDDDSPRWVTGTPAAAGAAKAEVTPGTTSKVMPARSRTSASSPPRPNTNGSPPLSLTTVLPRSRVLEEQHVDAVLVGTLPRPLADVDAQGLGRGQLQQPRVDEPVEQDHVRLPQQLGARAG